MGVDEAEFCVCDFYTYVNRCDEQGITQLTFTCLKSIIETLEKCVKYVQS